MGTYPSVYYGIYLRVKNKTVDEKKTQRVHPTTDKVYPFDQKFCPQTGVELITKISVVPKTVYCRLNWDVPDHLNEGAFFSPSYPELKGEMLFILSKTGNTFDNYDVVTLEDIDPMIEIENFKISHKPYLDWLDEGEWDYKIHYGIVYYGH